MTSIPLRSMSRKKQSQSKLSNQQTPLSTNVSDKTISPEQSFIEFDKLRKSGHITKFQINSVNQNIPKTDACKNKEAEERAKEGRKGRNKE